MSVSVVGISHRTAPVEIRERLAFSRSEIPTVLARLVSSGASSEAVLLSTCNRTELYFSAAEDGAGEAAARALLAEQWQEPPAAVFVPIGGGGLISGVAAWVKHARPTARVIGVEPFTADAMKQSLAAGEPVTIPPARTIADGLMPVRPGNLTFEHARRFVDDIVRVSDDAILDATRRLLRESRLVVEFSGAATVAGIFLCNAKMLHQICKPA